MMRHWIAALVAAALAIPSPVWSQAVTTNTGNASSGTTGSGSVVLATSPTLITPSLGVFQAGGPAPTGALANAGGSVHLTADQYNGFVLDKSGGGANPATLAFGMNQASSYTEIQSSMNGSSVVKLLLQRQGGGVSIGATSDPPANGLLVAGPTQPTGGVAAAGGFSVSPRNFATCGVSAGAATSMFTDQTPVATEVYASEVFVPANTSVTGVAIRSGSVASGNVKVGLADVAGNVLKTSASTAVAGAAGVYQRIAFTGGAYAAVGPATYYVLTFFDNATVRASAHTQGNCGAGKLVGQTYATGFVNSASLAPTTFTTALGPVASLY